MAEFKTIVIFHFNNIKFSKSEPNSHRITELSLMACLVSDCEQGNLPSVINQLTLAINPSTDITSGASKTSGLKDETLHNWEPFNDGVISMIDNFFQRLPKPICLIAHNGKKFQFKMLMKYYEKYKENNYNFIDSIYCADSITIFKTYLGKGSKLLIQPSNLGNKQTTSYTAMAITSEDEDLQLRQNETRELKTLKSNELKDIYYFLHDDKTLELNSSQSKCLALLKCILKFPDKFLQALSKNACLLSHIKPLS